MHKSLFLFFTLMNVFNTPILSLEGQLLRSSAYDDQPGAQKRFAEDVADAVEKKRKSCRCNLTICLLSLLVLSQGLIIGFGYKAYDAAQGVISNFKSELGTCKTRLDQAESDMRNATAQAISDCNADAKAAVKDCQTDAQQVETVCQQNAQAAITDCNLAAQNAINICQQICGNSSKTKK